MSMSQNIYDNRDFFDEYKKLRESPNNCNILEEKPAFFALLPDLKGKSVLDLGCGFGENCGEFRKMGASNVTGLDLSEKMLEVAASEHPEIDFIRGDMSDLSCIGKQYDIVVSSLAVHYLENFESFAKQVYLILKQGGWFVFSQEHPINTAGLYGSFNRDESGHIISFNLDNYMESGKRSQTWFVDNVIKYHRTFSEIINALCSAGFVISEVVEPVPDEKASMNDPMKELRKERRRHKPIFLLVKARKPQN